MKVEVYRRQKMGVKLLSTLQLSLSELPRKGDMIFVELTNEDKKLDKLHVDSFNTVVTGVSWEYCPRHPEHEHATLKKVSIFVD